MEVYTNPVGRDLIKKILFQKALSDWVITNPLVSRLKLKTLPRLTRVTWFKPFSKPCCNF
jgi:oligo-1,6-glucosidase